AVLQGKGAGFADRACQSLKQGVSVVCCDRGVTYQPALAQLVVADQAPAIEAQLQVGQFDIGPGLHRQLLQCAAKVITDITQRTGAKGQLQRLWPAGWPQLLQCLAQTGDGLFAWFIGVRGDRRQRICCEDAIAAQRVTAGRRIQQHGLAHAADGKQPRQRVGVPGQFGDVVGGHALSSGSTGASSALRKTGLPKCFWENAMRSSGVSMMPALASSAMCFSTLWQRWVRPASLAIWMFRPGRALSSRISGPCFSSSTRSTPI